MIQDSQPVYWWQQWDPTGSKPGDREGQREEPEEMETGDWSSCGYRQGQDWSKNKKKRRYQEFVFKRLEVMKKERVKERIYQAIISPN